MRKETAGPAAIAPYREPNRALLLYAVFGAPAAWSVDEIAAFYLHDSACYVWESRTAATVALLLVGVAAGAVAAGALATAWRTSGRLGRDTGEGETILDQRRFMAHAGLILGALFLFGILLRVLGSVALGPCRYP